jgi:hypothetical protein
MYGPDSHAHHQGRGNHRTCIVPTIACLHVMCLLYAYAGLLWHIILYADGITPGAVLSAENRRKAVVWYASFLELGSKLSNEECWLTMAIARTRILHSAIQLE